MLRIVTDTGSDIPFLSGKSLGLEMVELGVQFDEFPYDYQADTDFSVFYENLSRAKNLPSTSQVTPAQYLEIFEDAKQKGDEVLVLTLSSKLSGTYNAAVMAQEMSEYEGISVLDSNHCCMPQRLLAERAVKLRGERQCRVSIAEDLESLRPRLGFAVMMDTLTYVKKGGRVPPAMALLGEVLNLKPIIAMQDGAPQPLGRSRGIEAGKKALWKYFEAGDYDASWPVYFGYTKDKDRGEGFMRETKEKYGLKECYLYPVGGVIGTHAGPGSVAISYVKKA